jgi:transcriptional regulator GlxA family with amidase domain
VSLPRSRQSGYSAAPLARAHTDERIREAEAHLRSNFHGAVPIEDIARRVAMSPRNFIRRFKAATGRLPGAYVQMLRVGAAKQLLETSTLPVQQVCARSGYGDLASFRNVFKRHTGMTPVEYRERFGQAALPRPELVPG